MFRVKGRTGRMAVIRHIPGMSPKDAESDRNDRFHRFGRDGLEHRRTPRGPPRASTSKNLQNTPVGGREETKQ